MRVADRSTARNFLKYMNKVKTDVADTNLRIASGNRFTKASDDASAAARVLSTRADKYRAENYLANVKSVNEEMTTTEDALSSINDALVRVKSELLSKAMNDPTGDSRAAIADEIGSLKKACLQFINTEYNGRYLLGGSNASNKAPFTEEGGKLLYNGIDVSLIKRNNQGEYYYEDNNGDPVEIPMDGPTYMDVGLGITMQGANIKEDTAFQVSISGLEVLGFGTGDDGLPNNVIQMLTDIEQAVRDADKDKMDQYHTKLGESTDQIGAVVSDIGSKTKFLNTMEERIDTQVDNYQIRIKNLMGISEEEESTNMAMNDFALKAVLQMGAKILPVSLMDFLR